MWKISTLKWSMMPSRRTINYNLSLWLAIYFWLVLVFNNWQRFYKPGVYCLTKYKNRSTNGNIWVMILLHSTFIQTKSKKRSISSSPFYCFHRTRVRSLGMLVTNWLTNCCLVNLIDVKMTTQNLLRLRLKLSFCSYFEHKVSRFGQDFEVGSWSRFWRCLIKICVRTCDMT